MSNVFKITDWNKPDKDGFVNVPDELDPLVNYFGHQFRFYTISQAISEPQAVLNMVAKAQKFFSQRHEIHLNEMMQLAQKVYAFSHMNKSGGYNGPGRLPEAGSIYELARKILGMPEMPD